MPSSAPTLAALGDETRLWIVERLSREGPQAVTRLASGAAVTRQAVSKHLRVLEDAGLAYQQVSGREPVWQLEPSAFAGAGDFLDRISAQWDEALGRLKQLVEEPES
jgi:DNA-binding transcriptional ArsR family regulator